MTLLPGHLLILIAMLSFLIHTSSEWRKRICYWSLVSTRIMRANSVLIWKSHGKRTIMKRNTCLLGGCNLRKSLGDFVSLAIDTCAHIRSESERKRIDHPSPSDSKWLAVFLDTRMVFWSRLASVIGVQWRDELLFCSEQPEGHHVNLSSNCVIAKREREMCFEISHVVERARCWKIKMGRQIEIFFPVSCLL